jgi:hypothetical protein
MKPARPVFIAGGFFYSQHKIPRLPCGCIAVIVVVCGMMFFYSNPGWPHFIPHALHFRPVAPGNPVGSTGAALQIPVRRRQRLPHTGIFLT